jgi:GntR family transcriptional regulator, transcriptional repressor for pyruvate dehydrogenase complex
MPQLPPVSRLADTVASELEARILDGSLKPGDLLPSERELAVELGVSRPPIREAIQKLASKGLLTTRHGLGTRVTDRLEAHFVDPWQEMLKGHPMLQRDILEFRQMLEGQAAYLAAERALDVDIQRLDTVYAELCAAYDGNDAKACIDKDVAFHQAIAEAAHNVLIGHLNASLMRVIHGHISSNLDFLHAQPARWDQLKAQHHAIWQAVREHQPEAAANAARGHIDFVRTTMNDNALDEQRRQTAKRRLS